MSKTKLYAVVAVSVLVTICAMAQDDLKKIVEKSPVTKIEATSPYAYEWANQVNKDYAWTQEDWTGDDRPYIQIKNEVDQAIAKSAKPESLTATYNHYKTTAQKQPKDQKAQFAWAYTGYQIAFIDPALVDSSLAKIPLSQRGDKSYVAVALAPVIKAVAKVPQPYTYEFMRMRFLLAVLEWPMTELSPLGKRLVEYSPHDYEVIYQARRTLDLQNAEERKLALSWVETLVREKPTVPKYYAARGAVLMGMYPITKDDRDKAKAIADYEKFLVLAPTNDPFRNDAQSLIQILKQTKKEDFVAGSVSASQE